MSILLWVNFLMLLSSESAVPLSLFSSLCVHKSMLLGYFLTSNCEIPGVPGHMVISSSHRVNIVDFCRRVDVSRELGAQLG